MHGNHDGKVMAVLDDEEETCAPLIFGIILLVLVAGIIGYPMYRLVVPKPVTAAEMDK